MSLKSKPCMGCGTPLSNGQEFCLLCRKAMTKHIRKLPDSVPKLIREISYGHSLCDAITSKIDHHKPLRDQGFYLYGPAGVGKSHQAAVLMRNVMSEGVRQAEWVNVLSLLSTIRDSYGRSNYDERESEAAIVERYSKYEWLCMDDLGAEKTTDWTMQVLYLIINNRYENMLTTTFTSNVSLDELASNMEDDRLVSRITGMCRPIRITGGDRRLAWQG